MTPILNEEQSPDHQSLETDHDRTHSSTFDINQLEPREMYSATQYAAAAPGTDPAEALNFVDQIDSFDEAIISDASSTQAESELFGLEGSRGNGSTHDVDVQDTALFIGNVETFRFRAFGNGQVEVQGPFGSDIVSNIESFQFDNGIFNINELIVGEDTQNQLDVKSNEVVDFAKNENQVDTHDEKNIASNQDVSGNQDEILQSKSAVADIGSHYSSDGCDQECGHLPARGDDDMGDAGVSHDEFIGGEDHDRVCSGSDQIFGCTGSDRLHGKYKSDTVIFEHNVQGSKADQIASIDATVISVETDGSVKVISPAGVDVIQTQ